MKLLILLLGINTTPSPDSIGIIPIEGKVYTLHMVEAGQTLTAISNRYGVTVDVIRKVNDLTDDNIRAGVMLRIPNDAKGNPEYGKSATPATSTPEPANPLVPEGGAPIYHTVASGDSWKIIAAKYKTTVFRVTKWNNLKETDILNPGQKLIVGYKVPATPAITPVATATTAAKPTSAATSAPKPAAATPVIHKVVSGDILGSIAKKYGVSVSELKKVNNLKSENLSLGQKLIIPGKVEAPVVVNSTPTLRAPETPAPKPVAAEPAKPEPPKPAPKPAPVVPKVLAKKKVVASVGTSSQIDPVSRIVLHKTLPVGSVVKLVNPTNGRIAYARVTGTTPEGEENELIVSKAVYMQLRLNEQKFSLEMQYGEPAPKKVE